MNIQINRDLAVPIYTQIVGQMQFGIVSGHLPSGTQLPSIRDLAQELAVAPMTITQAYQELKQLGLIEMRPGLGTYVADFSVRIQQAPVPNGAMQLRRMLRHTVAEAQSLGFSEEEIRQTFLSLLTEANSLFVNHYLVLVGLFSDALRVYADDLERQLTNEKVVIEPVTFGELETRPDFCLPRLNRAEALLVPLHQVQALRDLLATLPIEWDGPIIGLSVELRQSAQQAIAAIPADHRIGVVSLFPEFVNTMIQGIEAVRPLATEPVISLAADQDGLAHISRTTQTVVYSSGADDAVEILRRQMGHQLPAIEYLHTPDDNSIRRIRQLLAVQPTRLPA